MELEINAKKFNPDPLYLREVISKTGLSQRECARRIGVDERMLRAYLAKRESMSAREASYPVQFALEYLAALATNADKAELVD